MIFDALIIGAGPAGATTASLLAQAGWSVAIVEKKNFPRRKVCGEFISATSLPLLQKLGVADLYRTSAGPEVRRVGLFTATSMLISEMPSANNSSSLWGRALGREYLDITLLDRAVRAGATLWQPYQVTHLERSAGTFICTVAAEEDKIEKISAKIIIMANGSWERGVEQAKSNVHNPSDLLAFKTHFKNCDLAPDLMPLIAFSGGYGGLVHSDSARITLSCCIRRDALQQARQRYLGLSAGEAVLQHIMKTCSGADKVLAQAQHEESWLAAGPIRPGIRKLYADGIFYVGNIAGEAHPVIAEGISMAMQSAWLLSEILIKHQKDLMSKPSDAGEEYIKRWHIHFANRIHIAALFAQFAMRPWAIGAVASIFKQLPSLLTFSAKLSGKVKQVVPLFP